jgi:hypothetical protein
MGGRGRIRMAVELGLVIVRLPVPQVDLLIHPREMRQTVTMMYRNSLGLGLFTLPSLTFLLEIERSVLIQHQSLLSSIHPRTVDPEKIREQR